MNMLAGIRAVIFDLILMNYFINEKFQQSIMENIKKFAEAAGINLDEVVEEGDK